MPEVTVAGVGLRLRPGSSGGVVAVVVAVVIVRGGTMRSRRVRSIAASSRRDTFRWWPSAWNSKHEMSKPCYCIKNDVAA